MDEYSVVISGPNLDAARVVSICGELNPRVISVVGESGRVVDGKYKKNVRMVLNSESSVEFNSPFPNLGSLLRYLEKKLEESDFSNSADIEVWALLYRTDQVNGELSKEEIRLLASIEATYCWSAIMNDELRAQE